MFNFRDAEEEEDQAQLAMDPEPADKPEHGIVGQSLFKLNFKDMHPDFALPPEFKTMRKLGAGAYGKVMEVSHLPSKQRYAVKRFEEVFTKEQRSQRCLRELSILKAVQHPCLNKLKSVIPPPDFADFNDVYLVLELCDMDMRKLLKSSKHLEEAQVKSIVYDILCGLHYLHKA